MNQFSFTSRFRIATIMAAFITVSFFLFSFTANRFAEDFLQQLGKNKQVKTFFDGLNKANLYAIAWRLQTAKKPETREKRLKDILVMLSEGRKFH